MIVVDASLAAKWFLEEPDSDAAIAFFERHAGSLVGPDILLVEVAGAIVRCCNVRGATLGAALVGIEDWREMWARGDVAGHRLTPDLMSGAVSIALSLGHPLADCVYLAIAIALDCELATCDVKFRDKASEHFRCVRLLADYDPMRRSH